jgi:hypothetical protein
VFHFQTAKREGQCECRPERTNATRCEAERF